MSTQQSLAKYGLSMPEILLPREGIDLSRWAVIACDQYTQDPQYWKKTEELVSDAPSTLNIILPEVYLEDSGRPERLSAIRTKMGEYLGSSTETEGVFAPPVSAFMYVERKTAYKRTRKGLVVAIDLDAYDWKADSKKLIRATEATIVDRIPPRMEIRRNAPIESPHIMLLVNDPDKTLVEAVGAKANSTKPLYETSLMHDSGSIRGWAISEDVDIAAIETALSDLVKANTAEHGSCFLFAVGDGNHSLASAKAVWDEFRTAHAQDAAAGKIDLESHPARFALAEIVNLYDDGLTFEPIHRVLFGTNAQTLSTWLTSTIGGSLTTGVNPARLESLLDDSDVTRFGFVDKTGCTLLENTDPALAMSCLQGALDDFITENPSVTIDYIHGTKEAFRLGREADTVAILLPPVFKETFFHAIANDGPLPRKSFSMGEASEKRFYMECRKLFG